MRSFFIAASCAGAIAVLAAQNPPAPQPPSQSEINTSISTENGVPPHYAVPDFLALTSEPETVAAARTIAEVLWNDLAFEREFDLIPRDTYRTVPQASSPTDVPFDRWR